MRATPTTNTDDASDRRIERLRRASLLLVVSLALLVLLLVPRLSQLDALVTPDEPLWIARSANFYQALSSGHLADTYQYVHPGVPVMWMGALGYFLHIRDLPDFMTGQVNDRNRDMQTLLSDHGYAILDVLVELRQVLAVASALVVIAAFLCLTRIVNLWAAAGAIAFMSLDPLHIGFTRLLHLDGLSTNLLILAMVAFAWYQQRLSLVALGVSGVAAGLAMLTRSANAVLGPMFACFALIDIVATWRGDRARASALVRRYLIHGAVLGAVAAATFVVLWPSMWVNPISTLQEIWRGGTDLAASGTEFKQFFRGNTTSGDPGWTYYPVVLAYRISPFTLVGLVLAALAAWRRSDLGAELNRRLVLNLAVFSVFYDVILSFSAKKYDRYLLPSIVSLDLIAALAWIAVATWLGRQFLHAGRRASQVVVIALVAVLLVGQGDLAFQNRPYYIDAASPLLGGTDGASEVFSFNWGEPGEPVADALETIDGIATARVVTCPWLTASIDYYLPFTLGSVSYALNMRAAAAWLNTDYVVVTYPEVQRQLYAPAMLEWFDQHEPIKVVTDKYGVYARIYDIRDQPVPTAFYSKTYPESVWGGQVSIVAADSPRTTRTARNLGVTLYLQPLAGGSAVTIQAQAVADDGTVVGVAEPVTATLAPSESPTTVESQIPLPEGLPDGRYTVVVTVSDGSTGEQLSVIDAVTGNALTAPVRVLTFNQVP